MRTLIFLTTVFFASSGFAQQVTIPLAEYNKMQSSGGQGCLGQMVEQSSQSLTAKFEQQQRETDMLMGISQKYFEHAKTCRNDLGEALNKFEQAKLRHQQERNTLPVKIMLEQVKYRQALLKLKRECDANATKQFVAFKEDRGTGVVSAPQDLHGRNERINTHHKVFYDDCMVSKLNVEQLQLHDQELRANLDLLQANMDSSADALASMTTQLQNTQDLTIKNCLEGQKQLEYQEALLKNLSASAESVLKKQNMLGTLSAVSSCLMGVVGGAGSGDTTNTAH